MPSALQVAAYVFLAGGAFHLGIGLLTAFFGFPPRIVGLSRGTDAQMWNATSEKLLEDPVVKDLRTHHHIVIAGLLVGLGLAEVALAWFGARNGEAWAFYALMAMGVLMVPYWVAMLAQFVRAGVHVTLWDVQPFVWVPSILWLVGTIATLIARPWAP